MPALSNQHGYPFFIIIFFLLHCLLLCTEKPVAFLFHQRLITSCNKIGLSLLLAVLEVENDGDKKILSLPFNEVENDVNFELQAFLTFFSRDFA